VTANGVFKYNVLWLFPHNLFSFLFIKLGHVYNVGEWEPLNVKLLRFKMNK